VGDVTLQRVVQPERFRAPTVTVERTASNSPRRRSPPRFRRPILSDPVDPPQARSGQLTFSHRWNASLTKHVSLK